MDYTKSSTDRAVHTALHLVSVELGHGAGKVRT